MALPVSRNTTYTALSQVQSADLNAIQDMIIGGRHGARTLVLGPGSFQPARPASNSDFEKVDASPGYWTTNVNGTSHKLVASLPMVPGGRINEVRVRVKQTLGTVTLTVYLVSLLDGTRVSLGSDSAGGTPDEWLLVPSLTNLVDQDHVVEAVVDLGTSSNRLYGGRYVCTGGE